MTRKPQPWYTTLNQPPRSPKDGRNRRPSAPTHRSPPDRTHSGVDPGSQDTTTFTGIPAATWRTINTNTTIYSIHPTPPAIPYAGVRAGEIIGHRMWYVLGDYDLCSLAHYFIWSPGAIIEGNLDEVMIYNYGLYGDVYGGVYSYHDTSHIAVEIANNTKLYFPQAIHFPSTESIYLYGIAVGTIKSWGEVIEHEKGWRAQYAKLQSIDSVIGEVDLNQLRSKYHV